MLEDDGVLVALGGTREGFNVKSATCIWFCCGQEEGTARWGRAEPKLGDHHRCGESGGTLSGRMEDTEAMEKGGRAA